MFEALKIMESFMTLDIINLHTQKLNMCEERFAQMSKINLSKDDYVLLYIDFVPTYTVARKILSNIRGTQDLESDYILRHKKITVPSKEKISQHEEEVMLFLQKVHAFAEKIEMAKGNSGIKPGTLIPNFVEAHITQSSQDKERSKRNTSSRQQDDTEGVSFLKPGFLSNNKK